MPANSRKGIIAYLAGKYPGKLGHLYNGMDSDTPRFYLPYALDNGVFGAWTSGTKWDEAKYFHQMEQYWNILGQKPTWVLCPDVVGDCDATEKAWAKFSPILRSMGFKTLAYALQDGVDLNSVPEADVYFIGGTTEWKWGIVDRVAERFNRVHVGRVNMTKDLIYCHKCEGGIESVDGTGFGRAPENIKRLTDYLDWCDGLWDYPTQHELAL